MIFASQNWSGRTARGATLSIRVCFTIDCLRGLYGRFNDKFKVAKSTHGQR